MKKEKICNISIICICTALLFMPTQRIYDAYAFALRSFFEFCKFNMPLFFLQEILTVTTGCIAIAISIARLFKQNKILKFFSSVFVLIYTATWLVVIFTEFPNRIKIFDEFNFKAWIIVLILYFTMLLSLIVLLILPYLPPHRPTKAERLQAQVDDLQKQVDELKKGE